MRASGQSGRQAVITILPTPPRRAPVVLPAAVATGTGTLAVMVALAAGWSHPLAPAALLVALTTTGASLAAVRHLRPRSGSSGERARANSPETVTFPRHRPTWPAGDPGTLETPGGETSPRTAAADPTLARWRDVLVRIRADLARDLRQFRAAMEAVVRASGEAADNTATMASAVEQLSASIAEIGRNATTSAEIARRAVAEMEHTSEAIRRTREATARIGRFVETIREVTERTKILALNATIEAARAGEAGRGFAVVAQEVKALAHRVDEIAAEIGEAARGIEAGVRDACDRAAIITASLAESEGATAAIASAVEQQHAVVRDLSERLQGMARAARELEGVLEGAEEGEGGCGLRRIADGVRTACAALDGLLAGEGTRSRAA